MGSRRVRFSVPAEAVRDLLPAVGQFGSGRVLERQRDAPGKLCISLESVRARLNQPESDNGSQSSFDRPSQTLVGFKFLFLTSISRRMRYCHQWQYATK